MTNLNAQEFLHPEFAGQAFLGLGADGEQLWIDFVEGQWFVHVQGNTESPFPFSSKQDALEFARLVGKITFC